MRLGVRIMGAFGLGLATLCLQAAPATAHGSGSDVITFEGPLYVTPAPPGQPPFGVVVSDTCQHTTGEGESVPCVVVATGALQNVGTADAYAVSSEGVFILDESFVFDPTTGAGTGTGSGTKFDLDTGEQTPVIFTASFTVAPTDNPNVFLDTGVVDVHES